MNQHFPKWKTFGSSFGPPLLEGLDHPVLKLNVLPLLDDSLSFELLTTLRKLFQWLNSSHYVLKD